MVLRHMICYFMGVNLVVMNILSHDAEIPDPLGHYRVYNQMRDKIKANLSFPRASNIVTYVLIVLLNKKVEVFSEYSW